jgi:hypothetical protein
MTLGFADDNYDWIQNISNGHFFHSTYDEIFAFSATKFFIC